MEAVIFMGLQASGKSSFYKENFFNSHIRLSMDLLNTRNRERKFLELSIETQAKVVVDNTNPELVLTISGHTDNIGKEEDNLQLSKDRSYAVKERLVSLGVEANRMTALFFGETQPIASNNAEEGRQINRRVVFDVKAK